MREGMSTDEIATLARLLIRYRDERGDSLADYRTLTVGELAADIGQTRRERARS
jgi:hypothetical protein